VIAGTDAQF